MNILGGWNLGQLLDLRKARQSFGSLLKLQTMNALSLGLAIKECIRISMRKPEPVLRSIKDCQNIVEEIPT